MIPLVVARNTFREATRDRVLAGLIVAGLALLVLTQVASPLALGEARRLTIDLGLSAISALGFLVVLLVATHLVAREIEQRTIYNLLSRPSARHESLIGTWAGRSASLWVRGGGLGAALWLVLVLRGQGGHGFGLVQAIYLGGLELTVVAAIAVLFSAISTPVLSALYTLGVCVLGQWSYDLREFAHQFPPTLARTTEWCANVLPNLPLFNMRTLASSGEATTALHIGIATLYALVYCGCTLCLATAAFESRDFK